MVDAEAAARTALGGDTRRVPQPRPTGDRTMLRVLLAARSLIDQHRTANRNALLALLRTVPLGLDVRGPLRQSWIRQVSSWRPKPGDPLLPARNEAKRLAAAVLAQDILLRENHQHLAALVDSLTPGLQTIRGVGPVTAAIMVCAYSHHGRLRDEAAFAALAGVAPLPASSGNTERHRLNRSGDRQLNRALDVIVRTRLNCDSDTRAYLARSVAAGKTRREARRNLKRYLVRSIFRQLRTMPALT